MTGRQAEMFEPGRVLLCLPYGTRVITEAEAERYRYKVCFKTEEELNAGLDALSHNYTIRLKRG